MAETADTSITIPKPGDWIRTDHYCWWNAPTTEHPATIHNAPIKVARVVKLTSHFAAWRVEATRCDGTRMHLLLDENGQEAQSSWDAARTGYAIVDAPTPAAAR